ncbi:hypothetical protein HA050_11875 [Iodobacter sp. HSC-16F04]|uniref:Uncharacterized protein n=1 Tax=Iodobacter violaceini TaxID=3044271 RepID=A0ABX0KX82_9NEIS|nr:hypothetical protein [Iodobacter violacea]NHQ86817.1 hypothetical protein [Iodobacter violacea]
MKSNLFMLIVNPAEFFRNLFVAETPAKTTAPEVLEPKPSTLRHRVELPRYYFNEEDRHSNKSNIFDGTNFFNVWIQEGMTLQMEVSTTAIRRTLLCDDFVQKKYNLSEKHDMGVIEVTALITEKVIKWFSLEQVYAMLDGKPDPTLPEPVIVLPLNETIKKMPESYSGRQDEVAETVNEIPAVAETSNHSESTFVRRGTLESFGGDCYKHNPEESDSFFLKINGREIWGVDLERALEKSGAKVGDKISLSKNGRIPVVIKKNIKSTDGSLVVKNVNSFMQQYLIIKC